MKQQQLFFLAVLYMVVIASVCTVALAECAVTPRRHARRARRPLQQMLMRVMVKISFELETHGAAAAADDKDDDSGCQENNKIVKSPKHQYHLSTEIQQSNRTITTMTTCQ